MTVIRNDVALLVHACDRYELLYRGFEFFFKEYWDFNIPCEYYFATEEKKVDLHKFKNITSGKGQWSDRLIKLLHIIPQQYVLYFQEDMWLTKKVHLQFFQELFCMAIHNDWKQVKLHSADVYKTIPTDLYIAGLNVTKLDNSASGFLMSHQVTLWNKQFLISLLQANEHPWRNERRATKRLRKMDPKIFHIDYFAENGHGEININRSNTMRSCYHSVSINGTLGTTAIPYIEELLAGTPATREYGAKLQYNRVNKLTHDGLPKPRKIDFVKRIKTWFSLSFRS